MNILHIEDDLDYFNRIAKPRLEDQGRNTVLYAGTREAAESILQNKELDYLIVDLAIPLSDGEPSEYENGIALVTEIRFKYPGLPILILTGQKTETAAQGLEDQETTFFWDGKKRHLVKIRPKSQIKDAINLVLGASADLNKLDDIEVSSIGDGDSLSTIQKRIFRLFVKSFGDRAVSAQVRAINGGLSGANVFLVDVLGEAGQSIISAVGKIDAAAEVEAEISNSHFLSRLPVGSSPVLVGSLYGGCADKKGVFFQFATNYELDYFRVLREQGDGPTGQVLSHLRSSLDAWVANGKSERVQVCDIRKNLVPDKKMERALDFVDKAKILEFEARSVMASFCVVHNDLHGKNILVSTSLKPVLIDYGDIREFGPTLVDPITLMLSPYFHPEHKAEHMYMSDEHAERIINFDLEYFGARYQALSDEFKQWVDYRSRFQREYLVNVYSYALRQLTYVNEGEVNIPLAVSLIDKSIERFNKC